MYHLVRTSLWTPAHPGFSFSLFVSVPHLIQKQQVELLQERFLPNPLFLSLINLSAIRLYK
jgi:hypothetical protein